MARCSDGESVLHKHLRVLDAFDPMRPFLTLSEIASVAGLAPSTTHRLVGELEREGLVERLPDRTYRLGLRLWEFASRTPGALGLREVARPWLNSVQSRVRQHTQLAVLQGRDVLFIERMSARDAVINATLIGGRLALPASSSGMVLLAHADPALVDEVVAAGWPRFTDATIRDERQLRRDLARVRADGFAVHRGHIHEDSAGIAVPIHGPLGSVQAALGVVVHNDDKAIQPIIELLTVAAAGISDALTEAYLPDGDRTADAASVRPLISTSRATLEYFANLAAGAPSG